MIASYFKKNKINGKLVLLDPGEQRSDALGSAKR